MKLSGWILRVSLIAMVALSLVFTFLIWQNPSRLGRDDATVAVKAQKDPNVAKQARRVFAPNTAYYQTKTQKTLLFTPGVGVTDTLHAAVRSWRLGKVKAPVKLSSADYSTLLNTADTLQLLYAAPMSYRQFDNYFFSAGASVKNANFTFDRLVIDLSGASNTLRFVNDTTRSVAVGKLTAANLTRVVKVVKKAAATGFPITEGRLGSRQVAQFTKPIKITPYTFLLDQQSANHFVSLLMPSSQSSAVDAQEISNETVYKLGTNQRLTLNNETEAMQFDDTGNRTSQTDLTTALSKGYAALGKLSLQGLSTIKYFEYDKSSQSVTFRPYAQGLPIFNTDRYGEVTVANTRQQLQMNFSMYNLIVAIPTKQKAVTLPGTSTVFAQLKGAGYDVKGLEDITLGYYWKPEDTASQVVELEPTYYVKIHGVYKRYSQWVMPTDEAYTTNTPRNPLTAGQ
ncbi:YycH family regulatory protein [Lacticaseibacillus parakribbianus]|uniref:YycH family regulatory protein n=1 Tax=Lacticaseibacillus parakribbianus TaxID=2970927 RepID=UPI0021CB26CC|nr:two-component system activity regulator YycH [Lacticaseibacillus parakribbianus]